MINHPKKDIIQIAVRPGFVLIPRELLTLDLSSNEFLNPGMYSLILKWSLIYSDI